MTDFVVVPLKQLEEIIEKRLQNIIDRNQKDRDSALLMNAKELCKFLGISLSTLNVWKSSSKIPFKRLGKRVFFNKQEVLDALEESNYYRIKELRR